MSATSATKNRSLQRRCTLRRPGSRCCVAALAFALAMVGSHGGAAAENGYWEPPGLHPADTPLAVVLQKVRSYAGSANAAYAQRTERYAVSARGLAFEAEAVVRGEDYAIRATLDGETYSSGRSNGFHWRRTPRGLVRLVRSDVQGDDLDRWPTATLPLSAGCVPAGETSAPAAAWVLLDRRENDIPHWFFIDKSSGAIVREITREGRRVEVTTFDDVRTIEGINRPFHWRVEGPGGALDVHVTAVEPRRVEPVAVAIPSSVTDTFPRPTGTQTLASTFDGGRISLAVKVEGRPYQFLLDTGTPQTAVSDGLARTLRKRTLLGHTVIDDLAIGDTVAREVPAGVAGFNFVGGILGYDFFAGRIVHIDYGRRRVETLPRESFAAPDGFDALASNFAEGMPIVPVRVGNVASDRFVLDTGSSRIVVLGELLRRSRAGMASLEAKTLGGAYTLRYLEGSIEVQPAAFRSFTLGLQQFAIESAELQAHTTRFDAEFPIEGVVGTDLLSHLDLWFDADGNRTWFRLQRP